MENKFYDRKESSVTKYCTRSKLKYFLKNFLRSTLKLSKAFSVSLSQKT